VQVFQEYLKFSGSMEKNTHSTVVIPKERSDDV
jgi:hypothetical protein